MNAPENARKCSSTIQIHLSYEHTIQKNSTIMKVQTSFTSIMPSSLLIMQNWSSFKGLVKILASWLRVSTFSMHISPLSAWSLMKWCLISICLVPEWWIGFLVILMALVLSQKIRILCKVTPKSLNYCLIHKIWAQQLSATIYSTSAVKKATDFCFLLD